MLKKVLAGGVAAIAIIALSACNQNSTSASAPPAPSPAPANSDTAQATTTQPGNNETVSAVKDAVAGAAGAVTAELTTSAQGFAQSAAMSDMYEIAAANITLMRSHSDDVKRIAQQMITDHTASTAALMAALMRSDVNMALPAMLDAPHQGLIDDLNGAKDQDFDTRYLAQQDNAHQDALILLRGYVSKGDNPDLQMFAQTILPKVQMHLDMIKTAENAHNASNAQAENR